MLLSAEKAPLAEIEGYDIPTGQLGKVTNLDSNTSGNGRSYESLFYLIIFVVVIVRFVLCTVQQQPEWTVLDVWKESVMARPARAHWDTQDKIVCGCLGVEQV